MAEHANFSNHLSIPLDQKNDPQQEYFFPFYNANITTNGDSLTNNMAAWDQQYLQPFPVNAFEMYPTTGNYYPAPIPPESFPAPYYTTNDRSSHMSLQNRRDYLSAGGDNPLDPNWEAISAFLSGHVRPGADVAQVYRCSVCNVEFANPKALGGHMSAHSKGRKKQEGLKSTKVTKPKKFKKTETKKIKKTKSIVKHEDVPGLE